MGWANDELLTSNIGDKRLDKRAVKLVDRLSKFGESFTDGFKSRAELVGACRFCDNNKVTPQKILSPHYEKTKQRIQEQKTVLLPNDTSSIDYSDKKTVDGLGILESSFTHGLLIHPLLAITPERICLGMVDVKMWARSATAKRKQVPSHIRNNQPIEEKESFRWIESYRAASELANQFPKTNFISIGDRESDILELAVEAIENKKNNRGADIIIRINHDRALAEIDEKKGKEKKKQESTSEVDKVKKTEEDLKRKLKNELKQAPIIGEITFTLPSREGNPEREVTQKLRAKTVHLLGKKVGKKVYPSIEINAICAIEENPPPGIEGICWMFFTTLPIDTAEQVFNIIKYYLCRWEIEVFFKVLKSGCKVEEKELKEADRIKNMLAIFFIIAWRLMYVMTLSRRKPEISCVEIFEDSEWMSIYCILNKTRILPAKPPSLGEMVMMIAKVGGYLPRKNSPPGPKVLWRGMRELYAYATAWECFSSINNDENTIKK